MLAGELRGRVLVDVKLIPHTHTPEQNDEMACSLVRFVTDDYKHCGVSAAPWVSQRCLLLNPEEP